MQGHTTINLFLDDSIHKSPYFFRIVVVFSRGKESSSFSFVQLEVIFFLFFFFMYSDELSEQGLPL